MICSNDCDISGVKLIAFDLDGTLTQHRSPLEVRTREMLEELSKSYKLLMIGAGACRRIFDQLGHFPIDIIGNYGLQYAEYNKDTDDIEIKRETILECDRGSVAARVEKLREKYSWNEIYGDRVEFHPSGAVTIPILGTKAPIEKKLAYDPDRAKRRPPYEEVKRVFPEYTVFIGGSSSYDMVPAPYDKYYAITEYCKYTGLKKENIIFVGDDYKEGGNDEAVYRSDIKFVTIDDYRTTPDKLKFLLK